MIIQKEKVYGIRDLCTRKKWFSSSCRDLSCWVSVSFAIVCMIMLGSCQKGADEVHETRFIMGTIVSFIVVADDTGKARNAIAQAAQQMQKIELNMTIYGTQPNLVKQLNATVPGETVEISRELDALLMQAQQLALESNHAFSPSLGALTLLWGFSKQPPPTRPPLVFAVESIVQNKHTPCLQRVALQRWQRESHGCQLDLGGIAKGYILDQGMKTLKAAGIQHAMINAGGDILLTGRHGTRPWKIGIRDPRKQGKVMAVVFLQGDYSIVTSGDYERSFQYQGRRYHHILDPYSGYPATASRSSTIIAKTATTADGWSTALFVAGSKLEKILYHKGLAYLVVDADGKLHADSKMLRYLQLEPGYSILPPQTNE